MCLIRIFHKFKALNICWIKPRKCQMKLLITFNFNWFWRLADLFHFHMCFFSCLQLYIRSKISSIHANWFNKFKAKKIFVENSQENCMPELLGHFSCASLSLILWFLSSLVKWPIKISCLVFQSSMTLFCFLTKNVFADENLSSA